MMSDDPFRHKWWGWGPAGVVFDMSGRPDFEAFIESKGLSIAKTLTPRVARSDIPVLLLGVFSKRMKAVAEQTAETGWKVARGD